MKSYLAVLSRKRYVPMCLINLMSECKDVSTAWLDTDCRRLLQQVRKNPHTGLVEKSHYSMGYTLKSALMHISFLTLSECSKKPTWTNYQFITHEPEWIVRLMELEVIFMMYYLHLAFVGTAHGKNKQYWAVVAKADRFLQNFHKWLHNNPLTYPAV